MRNDPVTLNIRVQVVSDYPRATNWRVRVVQGLARVLGVHISHPEVTTMVYHVDTSEAVRELDELRGRLRDLPSAFGRSTVGVRAGGVS